ncbi:MAG: tetratricopeptide repeat protein [Granulosicoccus sp.]
MDYETEEQQVEALKTWWKENGRAVVTGVVLGGVAIGGWGMWKQRVETQAVAASDTFSQSMQAVAGEDAASVIEFADKIREDQPGTLYAAYTNLAAARVAVEQDDLAAAAERLNWVSDKAPQEDVRLIAQVRLARVLGATDKVTEGLSTLPDSYPDAFVGLVEEARGDLHVLAGDNAAARAAYEKAQTSENVADANALTMKLNELATADSSS